MSMSAKQSGVGDLRIIIQCWCFTYQYFNILTASKVQQNGVLQPILGSVHSIRRKEREGGNDFP